MRGPRHVALLAVTALILAACGGAPPAAPAAATPTAAPPAAAKPGELDADTVAKAKQEGKIVWYTSQNIDDANFVIEKFHASASNPGIKVELVRASGEKLLARFVTESQAGKVLADVVETGGVDIAQPISQGLAAEFRAPAAEKHSKDMRDAQGLWTATRVGIETIAWNTDLVKPADAPKTFEDAADPKWKGKILLERDDVEILIALAKNKYKDDAKAREVFQKIAANNPTPFKGHSETTDLLIAGQGHLFFGAHGHRTQFLKAKKGAPIDWMRTESVLTVDGGFVAKGAPHPNAAKFFLNWLAGPEGAKALAERDRVPALEEFRDKALVPEKQYISGPQFGKEFKKYQEMWNEVFGLR